MKDWSIDSTPNFVFSAVAKNAAIVRRKMTGVSCPLNIIMASGTHAMHRDRAQNFKYRKYVAAKFSGPSEQKSTRYSETGRHQERDSDPSTANDDVAVIVLGEQGNAECRRPACPFAQYVQQPRHLFEPGQAPHLDRKVPEAQRYREANQHQIGFRAAKETEGERNAEPRPPFPRGPAFPDYSAGWTSSPQEAPAHFMSHEGFGNA